MELTNEILTLLLEVEDIDYCTTLKNSSNVKEPAFDFWGSMWESYTLTDTTLTEQGTTL